MPRKKRLGKTGVKHLPKKRRLEEEASEEESIQDEKQETAGEADNSARLLLARRMKTAMARHSA